MLKSEFGIVYNLTPTGKWGKDTKVVYGFETWHEANGFMEKFMSNDVGEKKPTKVVSRSLTGWSESSDPSAVLQNPFGF